MARTLHQALYLSGAARGFREDVALWFPMGLEHQLLPIAGPDRAPVHLRIERERDNVSRAKSQIQISRSWSRTSRASRVPSGEMRGVS